MDQNSYQFSSSEFFPPETSREWEDNQFLYSPSPSQDSSVKQDSGLGDFSAFTTGAAGNSTLFHSQATDVKQDPSSRQQKSSASAKPEPDSSPEASSSHGSSSDPQRISKQEPGTFFTQDFTSQATNFGGDSLLGLDQHDPYPLDDKFGAGMDNLSLGPISGAHMTGANSLNASPDPMSSTLFNDDPSFHSTGMTLNGNAQSRDDSPQMTMPPSKIFALGDSREQSPNDSRMQGSDVNGSLANYTNSGTMSGSSDMFNSQAGNGRFRSSMGPTSVPDSLSPSSSSQADPGAKWPCRLEVADTPEKSRVETQIPIHLTLSRHPQNIKRIHLQSYTISKPKFCCRPPHEPEDDTLELTTMLVCASAMQKDGALETAFQRAESDEPIVKGEDPPETNNGQQQEDSTDPMRPLNGGPVAICQGCIVRERKRAARKKTKKPEEEEEWQKDEAKRVIVFNCSEVKDWVVPGSKETAVKDADHVLDSITVNVPMRIACYCRHQNEKMGFQVIFTLKTNQGQILAQAISRSIMITDDHKQPIANPHQQMAFAPAPVMVPSQQFMNPIRGEFPFRTSYSTNDLTQYHGSIDQNQLFLHLSQVQQQQQQQQQHAPLNYHPQQSSTAGTTPKNLSRPPSPTNPDGQPGSKKRRSGGLNHHRIPSGLSMTRLDTNGLNQVGGGMTSANSSAVPTNPPTSAFSFASPTSASFAQNEGPMSGNVTSNPSTPGGFAGPYMAGAQHGGAFQSPPNDDMYQFYSAPTSQHGSRAPSPISAQRQRMQHSYAQHLQQQQQQQHHRSQNSASLGGHPPDALLTIPAGVNFSKPPIIQRVVPPCGRRSGGEEVTILGSGFCQGLEIMFGDEPASSVTFWGEQAVLCTTPPYQRGRQGSVPVLFKHQHSSAANEVRSIKELLPSKLVQFEYIDNENPAVDATTPMRPAMHARMMSTGSTSGLQSPPQSSGLDGTQRSLSQQNLARGHFGNASASLQQFSRNSGNMMGMVGPGLMRPQRQASTDQMPRSSGMH